MESLFGPLAHARRGNPDTSREAAREITPGIRQLQADVLKFAAQCGIRGFTDPDLNSYFGTHSSTYRTRRAELVALGLIHDTGNRVGSGKGRRHALWCITPAGQDRVTQIVGIARAA